MNNKPIFPHEAFMYMSIQRKLVCLVGISITCCAIAFVENIGLLSLLLLLIGTGLIAYSGYKKGGWNND